MQMGNKHWCLYRSTGDYNHHCHFGREAPIPLIIRRPPPHPGWQNHPPLLPDGVRVSWRDVQWKACTALCCSEASGGLRGDCLAQWKQVSFPSSHGRAGQSPPCHTVRGAHTTQAEAVLQVEGCVCCGILWDGR